jgi:hypothetical protein
MERFFKEDTPKPITPKSTSQIPIINRREKLHIKIEKKSKSENRSHRKLHFAQGILQKKKFMRKTLSK